ncbi:pyruvate dehydrogenase complex dihydrolipoamide acetyltransferase [Batrachochytrium salamandrivorans]|nr:pyruvate dehydrogenase complex dihydrolipoamide acetyltransferase [Batrachochytrium salamandrivorans]
MSCSAARKPLVEAKFLLTPSARAILGTSQAPSTLLGTGRDGRITKSDAIGFLSSQTPLRAAAVPKKVAAVSEKAPKKVATVVQPDNEDYRDIPLTTMRKVIATRLGESKSAMPHTYATMDVKIDSCLALRQQLKQINSPVPSMNDLVIKASALALKQTPKLNSQLVGGKIHPNATADISVAVATKAGLITPIIREADSKPLANVSLEMKDLAARAKDNKLKPAEFQGGSFTVSNLGMLGIADFTAIINLPQAAILAIGTGRPVLRLPSKASSIPLDSLTQADTMMSVTLSYDSRMVDPITASQFLQRFQRVLESPTSLL